MSDRRLWVLVDALPRDQAATWRDLRSDWTRQDELSALVVEQLAHWGPLWVLALTGGKGRLPAPQQLFEHPDRPSAKAKEPTSDAAEISRFFGNHIGGG